MPIPFLHSKTLALVSTIRGRTFTSQAKLQSNDRVSNGAGGFSDNWVSVAEVTVKLRRPKRLQGLEQVANQIQASSRWEVLCPVSLTVLPQQRFEIGSTYYYVLGTDAAMSDALMQIVQCETRG